MSDKWEMVMYRGKEVHTGHWPRHEPKIGRMVSLLNQYGWCFPPVPVVDLNTHYQALDGSHRIAASKRVGREPEIVCVDARLHPKQPIPSSWKEILNEPLARGRTIRGYGLRGHIREKHIGVVLDKKREMLREEYVLFLFELMLHLTRKIKILET